MPTNTWLKVYGRLWDDTLGVFNNYETPHGTKRSHYTKNKVVNEIFPELGDQHDIGISDNKNTLPSLVMAKTHTIIELTR